MTANEVSNLKTGALAEIAEAKDAAGVEALRVKYVGRNGMLPELMKSIKDAAPEERPALGLELNAFREEITAALAETGSRGHSPSTAESFDFSLPGQWRGKGAAHPVSSVIDEVTRIFARIGFTVADGPDIETEFNNFDALNTAPHHPSRDDRDTFWLDDGRCLRTQTSPVQIRAMLAHKQPPVRVITPGRCYRRDTMDATHSASFHQVEGLYVDTIPVSLADLKGVLTYFANAMMGSGVKVRFRPHFFPFTEPSVEVDFSCHVCKGKGCRICKQSGWIEIMGAGMVDPRVYAKIGYPEGLYGYAFGMGVERIAMIKHGITDLRHLYTSDLRFLAQFA